jgi:exodeoxyribonuclease V alpha subunit
MKHFGRNALQVLDAAPVRINAVSGVGEAMRIRVIELWKAHREKAAAVIEVMSIGLSLSTARRAVDHFGSSAADKLLSNPYLLTYVHGYGFVKADQFARTRGVEQNSDERIRAALWYCLNDASYAGHSYLPVSELTKRVAKEINLPEGRISCVSFPEEIIVTASNKAYVRIIYEAERYVSRCIRQMSYETSFKSLSRDNIATTLDASGNLSPDQSEALYSVLTGPRLSVITGLPGTGKTMLIKSLIHVLHSSGLRCVLAAPTGKAASRIAEQTGHSASTIHRVLGYNRKGEANLDENRPIDTDCLVIDESSMIDILLMQQVLRALPASATLILVGDENQLPSVGPGNILREVREKELCNIATLTQIHRQDSRSQIISLAHSIHNGRFPGEIFGDKECIFVREEDANRIRERVIELVAGNRHYPPDRIQVLCAMRKGPIGTVQFNTELKEKLREYNLGLVRRMGYDTPSNKSARHAQLYDIGDRVIQKVNNIKKSVFNGEIGYVVRRDLNEEAEGGRLTVAFDDGRKIEYGAQEMYQLDLALALTVHKGQGSEFPCVIIPVHTTTYIMLFRSLLYTAVTRARESVIIIGSTKASAIAVKNNRPDVRYSNLSEVNI